MSTPTPTPIPIPIPIPILTHSSPKIIYSITYFHSDDRPRQDDGLRRGYTNQPGFTAKLRTINKNLTYFAIRPLASDFDEKMLDEGIEKDGGLANAMSRDATEGWTTLNCVSWEIWRDGYGMLTCNSDASI
jgi:hypothetical protein